MLLKTTFQNNGDLLLLCNALIENNDGAKACNDKIRRNPNWIAENYGQYLDETVFCEFIDASIERSDLRGVLEAVVDHVNASCVTDKVFKKLINFQCRSIKKRMIVSLAHKTLSEPQLIDLCNIGTEFECFFELARLYYMSTKHSLGILVKFLENFCSNSQFSYMYQDLICEMYMLKAGTSEKSEWLEAEYLKANMGQTNY